MADQQPKPTSAMLAALGADGPFPDYADKLMTFGRLVGSWDLHGRFIDEQGNTAKETTGEWHFGWILEGRAIADVIISPPRAGRAQGEASRGYDVAVRRYDPKSDTWHVSISAPIFGVTVNLIARRHGDDIWQEGTGPQGLPVRWTFTEFSADRVLWTGYVSNDDGASWMRDEEIVLTRAGAARR